MSFNPLTIATRGFFSPVLSGNITQDEINAIAQAVWLVNLSQYNSPGISGHTLKTSLQQLEADYFKGDDRFIRYQKGTNTIILDKDVAFNPDLGYSITEHI
jgi:hypothetical protein